MSPPLWGPGQELCAGHPTHCPDRKGTVRLRGSHLPSLVGRGTIHFCLRFPGLCHQHAACTGSEPDLGPPLRSQGALFHQREAGPAGPRLPSRCCSIFVSPGLLGPAGVHIGTQGGHPGCCMEPHPTPGQGQKCRCLAPISRILGTCLRKVFRFCCWYCFVSELPGDDFGNLNF